MKKLIKRDEEYEKGIKKIKKLEFASNCYVNDISYFSIYENLEAINLGTAFVI